jgi:hypothetical protein
MASVYVLPIAAFAILGTVDTAVGQVATPTCVVGTGTVVMPSVGSGKCYCPGDYFGYCDPNLVQGYPMPNKAPYDALENSNAAYGESAMDGCTSNVDKNFPNGQDDTAGACGFYCTCPNAAALEAIGAPATNDGTTAAYAVEFTCCDPGTTMGLQDGTIIIVTGGARRTLVHKPVKDSGARGPIPTVSLAIAVATVLVFAQYM